MFEYDYGMCYYKETEVRDKLWRKYVMAQIAYWLRIWRLCQVEVAQKCMTCTAGVGLERGDAHSAGCAATGKQSGVAELAACGAVRASSPRELHRGMPPTSTEEHRAIFHDRTVPDPYLIISTSA